MKPLLASETKNSQISALRPRQAFKPAAAFSFLALMIINFTALPALAQERLLRTLTVTGQGEEKVQTSLAQVRLGVEAQGKTAQAVQAEVAQRTSAVVDLLRSRQVEKLETTGISLNPNYSYQENKPPILNGYRGSNIVSFQVPTPKAGPLLDEAVKAGATRIDGISFMATESALKTGRQQAIREAIQDAQDQADTVLSALNLTRQEIVSIQVNGATPPPPRPLLREAALDTAQSASTPIIGGEQEVRASVTLEFRY